MQASELRFILVVTDLILVELENSMSDRSYKTFQYPTCPDKVTKIKVKNGLLRCVRCGS